MKIAWFTPFYYKSAIGRYSKFAAEELSKHAEVHIYTQHKADLHNTFVKVINFEDVEVINSLDSYDICIYNIGDYVEYHAMIFEISKLKPGIIISHDVCLHNFVRGYYTEYQDQEEEYVKLLKKTYGEIDANKILKARFDTEKWNSLDLAKYSLAENLFTNSLGVVVHSNYHMSFLKKYYKGNSAVIPLIDLNELDSPSDDVLFNGFDENKINILTVGNINPNKKIETVIQALGENINLQNQFNYTIIGSISNNHYSEKLEKMVNNYNLNSCVKFMGFVNDDLLAHYYLNADILVNLRYPAFEGGSATLVEQLSLGKPIIVSKTGVYDEAPDDVVFKIENQHEKDQIIEILDRIMSEPNILVEYAEKAKKYAEQKHSRENYGLMVMEFIEQTLFLVPLKDMVISVRKELNIASPYASCNSYLKHIANELHLLFLKEVEK